MNEPRLCWAERVLWTHELERKALAVRVLHVLLLGFIVKVGLRFGEGLWINKEIFLLSS